MGRGGYKEKENMSIEKRLAAKKKIQKSKKRRVVKLVLAIVIPVVIIAAVAIGIWQAQLNKVNYERYITDEGTIKNVDPKDYITLANYKDMGITLADYQPSDDDITAEVESQVTAIEKEKAEAAETATETADAATATEDAATTTEEFTCDVDAVLTDAWVEENEADNLGDTYEHTVDGYKAYVKQSLYDTNVESLSNDISTYISDNTTVKSYPKAYLRQVRVNRTAEMKENFETNATLYSYYGYDDIYDMYADEDGENGEKNFKEKMQSYAESEVKMTLAYLEIFDELGLTAKVEDMEAYYTDQGNDYDGLIESYGEKYMFMQYKCSLALDALTDSIQ